MYIDQDYILKKINESELNKLTGEDESNLESAIESATSLIDSYISASVKLPINAENVPAIIKQVCYDLTIFYLHDRIQYNDIPERVKDKYDAAIAFLKDVASSKASISELEEEQIETTIQYNANSPVHQRNSI